MLICPLTCPSCTDTPTDGRIIDPQSRFWEAADANEFFADETMDCKGGIIAPSFIDVQINGAFGIDFSSPAITTEEVHQVSRGLLEVRVQCMMRNHCSTSPNIVVMAKRDCEREGGNLCRSGESIPAKPC